MGKYEQLASDIIKNVGGKENIISLTHCVTRLRFKLKDEKAANTEVLKNMDGVVTVMQAGGQYQVVIGNHVPDVYEVVCKKAGITGQAQPTSEAKKEKVNFKWVIGLIQSAILPTISVVCASGILKGVLVVFLMFGALTPESGLYLLLNAVSDAVFMFLPAYVGYNVASYVKLSPFVGMTLGLALCYPAINGVDLTIFGRTVNATYTSSFLPVIFCVLLAAPLEKFLNKVLPDMIKTFVTPMLVLVICLPLGFTVLGPAATWVSNLMSNAFNALFKVNEVVASTLVSGLWQILIVFGMHGVISMVAAVDVFAGTPSMLMGVVQYTSFAQMAVCLAISLKTKDKKLKNTSLPATISAFFGVTEPAIYGVTLPRLKFFVISCIGSAVSGLVAGIFHVKMYTFSGMGLFALFGMINPDEPKFAGILLALVAGFAVSFILTWVLFKDEKKEDAEKDTKQLIKGKEIIVSPLNGTAMSLDKVKDEAFAQGALGTGIAVEPTDGNVVSPVDGTVMTIFPTKHAIGLVSENGAEVLIHLGMDTVQLEGKHFTMHVEQGAKVKKGDLLANVDIEAVKAEGYSMVTPIVVTNTADFLDIVEMVTGPVKAGDDVLTCLN